MTSIRCAVIALVLACASPADAQQPNTPSRDDVMAAMRSVEPQVSTCAPSPIGGVVRVRVTFASHGRVKQVRAEGSASPGVLRCVERAVRAARVPRFRQRDFAIWFPFRV